MPKFPFLQFYPGDWLADPQLSLCTPATRGVWIDLLCAIHRLDCAGELRGTTDQLARIARCRPEELADALTELQTTGTADVAERNGIVTLVSRRMARDAKAREQWRLRQQKAREKEDVTHLSRSGHDALHISDVIKSKSPPVSPPAGDKPKPRQRKSPKTAVPHPFDITEGMRSWAESHTPGVDIKAQTEQFLDHHRAKGTVFSDWTAAWRTWMRNSQTWNGSRGKGSPPAESTVLETVFGRKT